MTLLDDAVALAMSVIAEGGSSTVVMLDNEDVDIRRTFLRPGPPTPSWEVDCAIDAAGAKRAVLVVPVAEAPGEMLHIVTVDLDWGFDVHRCLLTRGEDDQVTVGHLEHYAGQVQLHPMCPGYVLIQAMHAYQETDDEQAG